MPPFAGLIHGSQGGEQTNELRGLNKKASNSDLFVSDTCFLKWVPQIWELMLLKAFNAKLGDPITLNQAREIQVVSHLRAAAGQRTR